MRGGSGTDRTGGINMKERRFVAGVLLVLLAAILLTACGGDTVIELELTKDYSDTEPMVNEKLFYLPGEIEELPLKVAFEMSGESCLVEIADNESGRVLWHESWRGEVERETRDVALRGLEREREYVVRITGTGVDRAAVALTAHGGRIKERERPRRETRTRAAAQVRGGPAPRQGMKKHGGRPQSSPVFFILYAAGGRQRPQTAAHCSRYSYFFKDAAIWRTTSSKAPPKSSIEAPNIRLSGASKFSTFMPFMSRKPPGSPLLGMRSIMGRTSSI